MNKMVAEVLLAENKTLQLVQGDITQEVVDAIVNAANSQLQHGGGVAAAIAHRGGPQIQKESDRWIRNHGPIKHTTPAYTTAGKLKARYIIHAVGPVWGSGNEEKRLGVTVTYALQLADELEMKSLALPAISTGIFGFPRELAAKITLTSINNYFVTYTSSELALIRLTLFDQPTLEAFQFVWKDIFPG
ncbi:MAG: macro domain-containing protein [Anaerolineales bacterium]|nr:macro domain-containing protein [Anaerolineales bacterium]